MCFESENKSIVSVSDHNRTERKKIMDDMQTSHDNMLSILQSFSGVKKQSINYEDLSKFPLLEWVDLSDKVSMRRRNMLFKNYINFDTIIKAGGEFREHFHDDVIESAEVIEGTILDLHDNKTYGVNSVMYYEKKQKHTPIAIEDTILKVIFKP